MARQWNRRDGCLDLHSCVIQLRVTSMPMTQALAAAAAERTQLIQHELAAGGGRGRGRRVRNYRSELDRRPSCSTSVCYSKRQLSVICRQVGRREVVTSAAYTSYSRSPASSAAAAAEPDRSLRSTDSRVQEIISFFAARCYASAAYAVMRRLSVRPSVCLSR